MYWSKIVKIRLTPRKLEGHHHSLDGIRALAVMLVIGSHLSFLLGSQSPTPWPFVNRLFSGGFIGVDIFFVLSGFLITSLILAEISETEQFSLSRFYARRALRLLPALYFLLAVVFVVSIADGFPIRAQWNVTWAALLYIINWFYALPSLHNGSTEIQNNLGHLWSLAVEEQFYLAWPFLMFIASRRRRLLSWVPVLATILVVAVVLRRISLLNEGMSTWDLFLRTDVRLDSILVGSLLAFAYAKFDFEARVLKWAAFVALGSLFWFMYSGPNNGILFKQGFTMIAISAALVILASVDSSWWPNKVFGSRLMMFIGRISYGLYLWHFPIFDFLSRHLTDGMKSLRILIALLITLLATLLSWQFVETPSLRFKNRRFATGKSADPSANRLS